jgi:hypothetical protein
MNKLTYRVTIFLLVEIFLGIIPAISLATTYYVSPNGIDSNNGLSKN